MESYVLITLGILSSWLIWFSFMLYIGIIQDNNFLIIIFNRKQLIKYWLFIAVMVSLSFYLFFIRTKNMGKVVNIYSLGENLLEVIESLSWTMLIIIAIVMLLAILFLFLVMRIIYKNMHLRFLALYLYYYQYTYFRRKLVGRQVYFLGDFARYVVSRVMLFTQKESYVIIARIIWPRSFYWLESRICKIIIPYLIIFDVITQDGCISKVFMVIPWYYIYMLMRTAWCSFHKLFTPKNTEFSQAVYKKFLINGKIHRMAIIPDPKEFKFHDK